MEQTSVDTNQQERLSFRSRFWRVLRWIPISVMTLALGVILIMFLRGGMIRISAWYLLQSLPPLLGLITFLTLIVYAIAKRKFSGLFKGTALFTLLSLLPILLWFGLVAYPASIESTEPAATVRLPADVPLKVGWGGDSIRTNYHAAAPDQRWAYDLLVEPYLTGGSNLEEYGCYGVPVLAPASGIIIDAHDGEPDAIPGAVSNNFEAPTGNHVFIQLETGTYLVIGHLKPGSVSVEKGEPVEEGQQIGECGNSGNTSEPHIHIHHQRQDPTVNPINFAEGLPLYFRDHDGAPMPVGGIRVENGETMAIGDTVQHVGKQDQ